MAIQTVSQFRSLFKGVRSNRFRVIVNWPDRLRNKPSQEKSEVYIKAADIPEASIGQINVPWMGRSIKFSGERSYSDWAIQVYESNENQFDVRGAMEEWMELMDGRDLHNIDYNVTSGVWEIHYADSPSGSTTADKKFRRGIRLWNCFPINVGALQMDYDVNDAFALFPVTLAFDYWEPIRSGGGLSDQFSTVSGAELSRVNEEV